MKNIENQTENCATESLCAGRRQFLTRTVAGGVAIALGGTTLLKVSRAADGAKGADGADGAPGANGTVGENGADGADGAPVGATVPVPGASDYELVVKPSEHPELAKVGGFVTLDTKAGKITVARVSETEFSAVGGVCTHKGGPIEYNSEEKQFFCPWHKSKFALDGAVTKGPAKIALQNYKEETAAVIKLS